MAPRTVNPDVASSVVSESLGMSLDDLGAGDVDTDLSNLDIGGDDGDGDDTDGDNNNLNLDNEPQPQPQPAPKLDDLSVTHTRTQPQNPIPKKAEVKADKQGNLIGADGKIVARAGKEARLYQDNHGLRQRLQQVTEVSQRETTTLRQNVQRAVDIGMALGEQLKTIRDAGNMQTRYGLSDSEATQAFELAKMAKTQPVEALKKLLTQAAASGIDLSSLGLQPGGFDTKSLMEMVREEIAKGVQPVVRRTEQDQQREQVTRENEQALAAVQTELSTFLTENPTAKKYLEVFRKAYESPDPRLRSMSLGEIWSRLQLNLMRQGIDPNAEPDQRSQNPPQRRRLPSGRGNPPGGSGREPVGDQPAPLDMSYDDIIKSVLTSS